MISAGRVLLMPKGDYNPATTYELLDLVTYQNSSYIAKGTTTGNLPTDSTYWQLSAFGGNIANLTGNFAEVETSTIAQASHSIGDIFVDSDSNLVEATAQININDTIAIGTNCALTTVEALIAKVIASTLKFIANNEISVQTDLDTVTTFGDYYKSSQSFYVTNAPTGIDSNPLSKFRLTVFEGPGTGTIIQSIVDADAKAYKRVYDGTSWGNWIEFASGSVVSDLATRISTAETDIDNLEASRQKTFAADATAWDTTPTTLSTKPVTSGGVKTELDKKQPTFAGDSSAWDSVPTAASNNPVTSDGLKAEFDKKLFTYAAGSSAWDTTPTASSTKPVTSGGVKTQIDTINGNKANQTVIATRQANLVASRRYEIGEQFIYNNTLYRATQVIAANTNINTGSGGNATTADNISSQISNIDNSLSSRYITFNTYGATFYKIGTWSFVRSGNVIKAYIGINVVSPNSAGWELCELTENGSAIRPTNEQYFTAVGEDGKNYLMLFKSNGRLMTISGLPIQYYFVDTLFVV